MHIEVAYTQHSGISHPSQQDALLVGKVSFQDRDLPVTSESFPSEPSLVLAIADGVAISPFPQVASRFVMEALTLELNVADKPASLNSRVIRRVHGRLCDRYAKGRTRGSATTIAAIQCEGERCAVVNVGDSRVYRIAAAGKWIRLSHDHTVLEGLVESGQADPTLQYSHIYDALEYCLIADDEEDAFPIHSIETAFLPGDRLLLCTDGVHDCLGEENMQRLFDGNHSLQQQADIWRKAILAAGAPDNFSLILAQMVRAN